MWSTEETTISEVQSAHKECHSYTYIEYMHTYYVYIASIHSYMGHTHTKHEIPRNYTYINTLHITLLHVYTYICVQCYTYKFCKHTSIHIEPCTLTCIYICICIPFAFFLPIKCFLRNNFEVDISVSLWVLYFWWMALYTLSQKCAPTYHYQNVLHCTALHDSS